MTLLKKDWLVDLHTDKIETIMAITGVFCNLTYIIEIWSVWAVKFGNFPLEQAASKRIAENLRWLILSSIKLPIFALQATPSGYPRDKFNSKTVDFLRMYLQGQWFIYDGPVSNQESIIVWVSAIALI